MGDAEVRATFHSPWRPDSGEGSGTHHSARPRPPAPGLFHYVSAAFPRRSADFRYGARRGPKSRTAESGFPLRLNRPRAASSVSVPAGNG
ncbi:conserved hypothetical protein [Streptomyces sp. SPB78]|nr:conserved hypothetical protein [Streptomyces sp. SPB78]